MKNLVCSKILSFGNKQLFFATYKLLGLYDGLESQKGKDLVTYTLVVSIKIKMCYLILKTSPTSKYLNYFGKTLS
jgi:hypothetical protein